VITAWDATQYLGVALGFAGAVLVAGATTRNRRWGFGLWIASNACLVAWTLNAAAWGLLAMYAVYSITSSVGLWNNRADAETHVA
jgi:hypothetical protein